MWTMEEVKIEYIGIIVSFLISLASLWLSYLPYSKKVKVRYRHLNYRYTVTNNSLAPYTNLGTSKSVLLPGSTEVLDDLSDFQIKTLQNNKNVSIKQCTLCKHIVGNVFELEIYNETNFTKRVNHVLINNNYVCFYDDVSSKKRIEQITILPHDVKYIYLKPKEDEIIKKVTVRHGVTIIKAKKVNEF